MYYVYILLSLKDNRLYIGCTGDINRRMREHSDGRVKSTKNRRPLVLLGYETFDNRKDGMNQEKYYKSGGKASNDLKLRYKDLIEKHLKTTPNN